MASFWSAEAYSIGKHYDDAIANYTRVIGLESAAGQELVDQVPLWSGLCVL